MKNILLIIALMLPVTAFCQTGNSTEVKSGNNIRNARFCQIVGSSRTFSKKLNVEIEFGKDQPLSAEDSNALKDDNGKAIVFESMIDALNHMTKHGWKFVQAYSVLLREWPVHHYILTKEN